MVVENAFELVVIGLDLRLRGTSKEAIALSELQRVTKQAQRRERVLTSLSTPVLLGIIDCCCTPLLDLLRFPVAPVQHVIVLLL